MLTVFVPRLPGVPLIPLLYPSLGRTARPEALFLDNAYGALTEPLVEVVPEPGRAAVILVPHNFGSIRREHAYLAELAELARTHDKRLVVFWHGDRDEPVELPGAVVFRTSLRRGDTRPGERAMPAYTEDLLGDDPLVIRPKGVRPVVGFCGWAEHSGLASRAATLLRDLPARIAALRDPAALERRRGVTIRREVLRVLEHADGIETRFIRRRFYAGRRDTIAMDPDQARREYRANLLSSDLALAIRGDGNFSYRFYEALSVGRVPLLVDTSCVLPREEELDYGAFTLRVPLQDLPRLPERVCSFWRSKTSDELAEMQRGARAAYTSALSVPAFLRWAVGQLEHPTSA